MPRRRIGVLIAAAAISFLVCGGVSIPRSTTVAASGAPFTFNWIGTPAAPLPTVQTGWDTQIHVRTQGDQMSDPMAAQHGADCSAPPAVHVIQNLADGVFICKNHLMTAIGDQGYGEIALTPDHMADWSSGTVAIKLDVSTLQFNDSDFLEIYVTPFSDNNTLPCEINCPDLQGNPKDGLKFSVNASGLLGTHSGDVERIDNFTTSTVPRTSEQQNLASLGLSSPTVRTTFEMDISQGHVRFGLPSYNVWWTDTNISPLSFTQGIVQITHHSYNPLKHAPGTGIDTWHWSNFSISNAVPFAIISGNERSIQDGGATTVHFPAPSPTGSWLRFSGFGTTQVSFDGGATWSTAAYQATCGCTNDPAGHFHPNWTLMPTGISTVMFRGDGGGRGPWWVRDPAIWSAGATTPPVPTAPSVSSVTPNNGPTTGGTSVTIAGANFTGATAVKFGAVTAPFTFNSDTSISATTPANAGGPVDVTVTTPSATSATSSFDQFTYTGPGAPTVASVAPNTGPAAGGTPVIVSGTNLTGATAVKFGSATATYTVTDATHIAATSPARSAGVVDVTVTTPSGTTATNPLDKFTYAGTTVTGVAPSIGPAAGGTPVIISGSNFTGATAVQFGTASATYTVTDATHIAATSPAGSPGAVDVTVTTPSGTSPTTAADRFTYLAPPGAYTAQSPNRILDTRLTGQTVGGGGSLNLTVAGGSTGVPANATGVVLNVTATNTNASSAMTIWPAGSPRPLASNLNWVAGETRPNLVNVPVGPGGQVSIFNFVGSTDVVVDEEGYFAVPSGTAGGYNALAPARLLDTRNTGQRMSTGNTIDLQILGAGGVPATGVSAVVLNATATNTKTEGFLTLFPSGTTRPLASNVNWKAGWTIPNRVIVKVGSNGKVSIYNGQGSTDAVIDVSGYFTDSTASGKFFTPLTPTRILDTRVSGGTIGPTGMYPNFQIAGNNGVPIGATAVFLNVTVTNTTASSALTGFPGASMPTASDLNWVAGQSIPNLDVATLGPAGTTNFYNYVGSTDLVIDLSGWFS